MTATVTTLVVGVIAGYLGQRSRMCFVGGIRDFILVRDTALLKGLVAFGFTAWLLFPLAAVLTGDGALRFGTPDVVAAALTIVGGFGVGYVSTLANGCPLRQHVLAAQGAGSSMAYLAGFLGGALVFHVWIVGLIARLLP
jgi:uncharacterized membrane protein YedE/YeeE